MSVLRIRISLTEPPLRCEWALVNPGSEPVCGEGGLGGLPRRAARVQLVIPASQVLLTRAQLPPAARRQTGAVLAYALEEETVGEPDASQVTWLGSAGNAEILAVLDKQGLARWLEALAAIGIDDPEVHCESLLLPWVQGEWRLAWDGREGTVRSGLFEGGATDSGDRHAPPLSLRLALDEARTRGDAPASMTLLPMSPDALPDLESWALALGIELRAANASELRNTGWRGAPLEAGVNLARRQGQRRWRLPPGLAARLRPAAWIVLAALLLQAGAAAVDWTLLSREQRALRQAMEATFRASFPDALAVADPALQMRRKLAEARRAAGRADRGDFLPMLELVATATADFPLRTLRTLSYDSGRMSFGLTGIDQAGVRRLIARLTESGLIVDPPPAATSAPNASAMLVITVRAQ